MRGIVTGGMLRTVLCVPKVRLCRQINCWYGVRGNNARGLAACNDNAQEGGGSDRYWVVRERDRRKNVFLLLPFFAKPTDTRLALVGLSQQTTPMTTRLKFHGVV